MGLKNGRDPLNQGFDEFFGLNSGNLYIAINHPEAVNGFGVSGYADLKTGERRRPVLRGTKQVKEDAYLTEAFTREALDFITRQKDKPFFLYLAYNAPHAPLQVTKKYYDRFPSIKDENSRIYAGMVSALDDGVGAVLAKLKELKLEKNTIVVFLSDNGCPGYGNCSNAQYAGYKRYHLEGGHRVAFFISWPARLKGGRVYGNPISALDLFPTFAAASGAQLPSDRIIDGVNLLSYLTGKDANVPHPELFWRSGGNYAVRHGKWKLVVVNRTHVEEFLKLKDEEGGTMLDHPPFPGVSPLGQHVMLFDLGNDPGETKNLAAAHPDVVQMLKGKYEAWDRNNVPGNVESASGVPTVIDGQVLELSF
jgi:arylsulfatase A-like enzyme